jgi:hypothetical protein
MSSCCHLDKRPERFQTPTLGLGPFSFTGILELFEGQGYRFLEVPITVLQFLLGRHLEIQAIRSDL